MLDPKKVAAEQAVEEIRDGMVIGLGTGSTSEFAIQKIGDLVKGGLRIQAVCTSIRTESVARMLGIPLTSFEKLNRIDLSIDGADQVDHAGNLIKGGGGSLLREKIIEYNSDQFLVIVDESKCVEVFHGFPLPVEIVTFATPLLLKRLQNEGCIPVVRRKGNADFITDNGNLIVDCHFDSIPDPAKTHWRLKAIPGVVETGIFLHSMVSGIIIGHSSGKMETKVIR